MEAKRVSAWEAKGESRAVTTMNIGSPGCRTHHVGLHAIWSEMLEA